MKISKIIPFDLTKIFLRERHTSIFGHLVSDNENIFTKNLYNHINKRYFIETIKFLKKNFNIISIKEYWDIVKNNKKLPKNSLTLSFDDGHKEMANVVAPILLKYEIPATFFLVTESIDNFNLIYPHKKSFLVEDLKTKEFNKQILKDVSFVIDPTNNFESKELLIKKILNFSTKTKDNMDKIDLISNYLDINWTEVLNHYQPYLTSDDISEMISYGFDIGSHGLNHISFRCLSDTDRLKQINLSLNFLSAKFKKDSFTFSFPNSADDINEDWMNNLVLQNNLLDGFVGTGKFKKNGNLIINRINMDTSLRKKHLLIKELITKYFFKI